MSIQPTRGEWYAEQYDPDSPTFRKWIIKAKHNRKEDNFPDSNVCDITHVWHNSVTRGTDEEKAKRVMELGAVDYVTKPLDFHYLDTSIKANLATLTD